MFTFGFGDFQATVINAVCCQRPAVIFAFLRDVDFIPAARAMFVQPERVAPRIHRHSLRVANAIRPDFRPCAGGVHKGVIRRDFTVLGQAHHFPLQLVQVLRRRTLVVLAESDKEVAFAVKHQPSAKMVTGREFRHLAEHDLECLDAGKIVA